MVATVGASSQQVLSSERVFTETEADRFYRLLRRLRNGAGETFHDLHLTKDNGGDSVDLKGQLDKVGEGDFMRIKHAHLLLPHYAAIYPPLRYASYTASGAGEGTDAPQSGLYAPPTRAARKAIKKYIERIGPNPRLPFMVTAEGVTFLIPARYRGLGTEPSLLSGNLTVVGKLVFKSTHSNDMPFAAEPR
jgi:alkanesulfonate monooxygenase SsuD/methylene tetrahydromethanopterin reductase-like flavin-dependent oxidoreductase (luciferase family)